MSTASFNPLKFYFESIHYCTLHLVTLNLDNGNAAASNRKRGPRDISARVVTRTWSSHVSSLVSRAQRKKEVFELWSKNWKSRAQLQIFTSYFHGLGRWEYDILLIHFICTCTYYLELHMRKIIGPRVHDTFAILYCIELRMNPTRFSSIPQILIHRLS